MSHFGIQVSAPKSYGGNSEFDWTLTLSYADYSHTSDWPTRAASSLGCTTSRTTTTRETMASFNDVRQDITDLFRKLDYFPSMLFNR